MITPSVSVTLDDIKANLGNRWWRLNHLYYIKDENGKKVLFKPNKVQTRLHDNLWFFNIVPKARQLGVTTFFSILYFDQILFSKNKTAGIIAHRQEDMKKIFREKIRFAWDNLHPWLRTRIGEPETDTANEMRFPNGSNIFVSMSTRSGTVQFLHISEFGYICQRFPEKAEEIVTGAINSVHPGNMVSIESTAAGREGHFYDFCMEAERAKKEGRALSEIEFKLQFFPWYADDRYTMEDQGAPFTQEFLDYFKNLEVKHGIGLTNGQKRWYVAKKKINKRKMYEEYPSTLEEAFMASTEGSYFSKDMERVFMENRICVIPFDPELKVETWWDLGMNDFNVVLLTQTKGGQIRFINMYWNSGEGLPHYAKWLDEEAKKYGYRYHSHNFPHDISVRDLGTGISRHHTLISLGLHGIRVAPKAGSSQAVNDDIDRVRALFPRFWFDEVKCKKLHTALFNYQKEFDKKLGVFKDKPKHDENSHFVDPVRVLGQLWREEIFIPKEREHETEQAFFG